MKPKLIIFDFDGVIIDTQSIINEIEWSYLHQHGMHMTLEVFSKRFSGMKSATIIEVLRKENNIELTKRLREVVKEIDDALLAALSKKSIEPFKGVKKVLQNLPYKKCIASNGALRILRHLLSSSGLAAYFDYNVFSADMVERPKPFPDLFLYAARSMGIDPKLSLVIEDSEVGVKAAIAAGMRVWGFLGGKNLEHDLPLKLLKNGAEKTFKDMEELPSLLEASWKKD
ncbi:MAG: HAD family phosphatase [Alphaproteobacteria bacterium]|nr:HAD family phosphatase [Alphaproteobacteria bacterium]